MLELKNIHKSFDDFRIIDINLEVKNGDYYVVLGKSGAGKTILLETIAGLLIPDKGTVWLDGENITNQSMQHRRVGLVFQDYAIFPHKTVYQNIAYPLKRKKNKKGLRDMVFELAEKTGVENLIHRYPSTLSGGEIQRTVLARTLALEPEILLLDEPLASLDIQYRRELQSLLRKLNADGQTIVHVTHDYEEALALSDYVAVMNDGRVVQEGEVHEVFRNPRDKFTANFVGIRNFFKAKISAGDEQMHKLAKINEQVSLNITGDVPSGEDRIVTIDGRNIIISIDQVESTALNNFQGTINEVIPISDGLEIIVDVGIELAVIITESSFNRLSLEKGKKVWVSFKASSVRIQNY